MAELRISVFRVILIFNIIIYFETLTPNITLTLIMLLKSKNLQTTQLQAWKTNAGKMEKEHSVQKKRNISLHFSSPSPIVLLRLKSQISRMIYPHFHFLQISVLVPSSLKAPWVKTQRIDKKKELKKKNIYIKINSQNISMV